VADLAEADIVQVVRREVRKREEAEAAGVQAGRTDVIEQNRAERSVLEAYVPPMLDEGALETLVRGLIEASDRPSIGSIMASLKSTHGGQYDGKLASDVARRLLAEGN